MKHLDILNKLISREKEAITQQILSPVIQGTKVCVKIASVIVHLNVFPNDFVGWGIFSTDKSLKEAKFVEEPNRRQQREYLELLPKALMVICEHNDERTVGSFLNNDDRFPFDAAPIFFPQNISLFDVVSVRYNGQYFIYERHYAGKYTEQTEAARDFLNKESKPDKINLHFGFARAYAYAYEVSVRQKKLTAEDKVKTAVARAGGNFRNMVDRGGIFTVSFEVDGQTFTPTVNANNLMLENAGICLSGGDRAFDLESFCMSPGSESEMV
jgi:hypothetical protein